MSKPWVKWSIREPPDMLKVWTAPMSDMRDHSKAQAEDLGRFNEDAAKTYSNLERVVLAASTKRRAHVGKNARLS